MFVCFHAIHSGSAAVMLLETNPYNTLLLLFFLGLLLFPLVLIAYLTFWGLVSFWVELVRQKHFRVISSTEMDRKYVAGKMEWMTTSKKLSFFLGRKKKYKCFVIFLCPLHILWRFVTVWSIHILLGSRPLFCFSSSPAYNKCFCT